MSLIWRLQPISVSDLLGAVNGERAEPIVRNTLQTQLKRIESKGWIEGDASGSVRLYRATIAERPGRGKMLMEMKKRLFGGSGTSLVRCLMEEGDLTENEICELNSIIKSHRKGERP